VRGGGGGGAGVSIPRTRLRPRTKNSDFPHTRTQTQKFGFSPLKIGAGDPAGAGCVVISTPTQVNKGFRELIGLTR